MEAGTMELVHAWEAFYVIVGPSAAVLIGLQFVALVLSTDLGTIGSEQAVGAFATPTIVHFCAALAVSVILSAPWPWMWGPALTLGACGAAGLGYTAVVMRRALRQSAYEPVLEDWLWHCALPMVAYAALAIGAALLGQRPVVALFTVGAASVLLLFIGLHNTWDAVTYIALNNGRRRTEVEVAVASETVLVSTPEPGEGEA